jgi:hypothetical protein
MTEFISMAYNNWPAFAAGVVGLAVIVGWLKGWVSPGGSFAWLFWLILYLSPPAMYFAGYFSPRLHRVPKILMEDPSAFVAGGTGPVITLGVAYIGALFVAGGSERASLIRLMSYLFTSWVWSVAGATLMTHIFDTKGIMMWAVVPTVFTLAGAAVTMFVCGRNMWQRSPAEHHRSLS